MIGAGMNNKFLAVLVGTGLALTACTGSPGGAGTPTSPPSAGGVQGSPTAAPSSSASKPPAAQDTELLRDIKCAADDTGSWSFDAYLVNDQDQTRTFTVAIAVTVGMEVKGHDLVVHEVPGNSEAHITRNYFAQADDKDAVCEPVVSAEG